MNDTDKRRLNGRTPRGLDPLERFIAKIEVQSGTRCWLWIANVKPTTGYASFQVDGKNVNAHRWIYKRLVGPVPDGLYMDHLCRVRHCVNPWHMEPVTPLENVHRGDARPRTHCPEGHPYAGDNLYVHKGARHCITCRRSRKVAASKRQVSA